MTVVHNRFHIFTYLRYMQTDNYLDTIAMADDTMGP